MRSCLKQIVLEWVRHSGSHLLSQYFGGQSMKTSMSLNLGLYSEFQGSLDQKQKQKSLRLTVFMSSAPVCTALDSRSHGSWWEDSRVFLLYLSRALSLFSWTSPLSFGFQQSITTGLDFICILHKLETFSEGMFSIGLFCSFCFPSVTSVTQGQMPSHFPRLPWDCSFSSRCFTSKAHRDSSPCLCSLGWPETCQVG